MCVCVRVQSCSEFKFGAVPCRGYTRYTPSHDFVLGDWNPKGYMAAADYTCHISYTSHSINITFAHIYIYVYTNTYIQPDAQIYACVYVRIHIYIHIKHIYIYAHHSMYQYHIYILRQVPYVSVHISECQPSFGPVSLVRSGSFERDRTGSHGKAFYVARQSARSHGADQAQPRPDVSDITTVQHKLYPTHRIP